MAGSCVLAGGEMVLEAALERLGAASRAGDPAGLLQADRQIRRALPEALASLSRPARRALALRTNSALQEAVQALTPPAQAQGGRGAGAPSRALSAYRRARAGQAPGRAGR